MSIPQSVRDRLTPAQLDALVELEKTGGNFYAAAKNLKTDASSFRKLVKRARKAAAAAGWAPSEDMVKPAADGFRVKGTSTLYTIGKDGKERISAQWVKTREDQADIEQRVRDWVSGLADEVQRPIEPVDPPGQCNSDLMSFYPMGDPHVGMYAWAAETGANFDLKIAEQDLFAAVDYLVGQSPPSHRAALINLGDFFHTENLAGTTTQSGHALDTDGRLHKMLDTGYRVIRRCIHRMLEKHAEVEIINAPGNHDRVLAMAMSLALRSIYEDEPRLVVHDAPTMRHYIQHGKCLIGVVHGDQTKDHELPGIMATERAEQWGQTKFRYFWRGHHHHDSRKEYNGCMVEQFRTLAAGDAYAIGHGYLSGRDMKCIVMHKDYGERARFTCGIDVLRPREY